MDSVFIEGLRLSGRHGVLPGERKREQEFLIDIEARFDANPAAASDDLSDTLDYAHFAAIARALVERESFYLIERLAERIASAILEDRRVERVEVTVRKPQALGNGVPGVRILREAPTTEARARRKPAR